ncbi:hypothetical protein [Sphingomonas sp. PP-CE-1G-424]|uniref:hypothetical protein n=1 Tax=Sphingomonas sp. PP-CE-1G-424 TaxID=2135658 RepID=UPI001FB56099|nr:hypothetical protein [Sphingomonas sp. PP-CE-1G-424]
MNDRRQDQNEARRKRPRFSVFDPRKRNPTDPDLRRKNLRMVRRAVPFIQIGTRLNDEGVPAPVVGSETPRRSERSRQTRRHPQQPALRGTPSVRRKERSRNPDTEKHERRYRLRNQSEWAEVEIPDLQIIDDTVFEAARDEI